MHAEWYSQKKRHGRRTRGGRGDIYKMGSAERSLGEQGSGPGQGTGGGGHIESVTRELGR